MAKKRTPQELERIRQRKEFVQSKPDLDPAEARQRFFVQTRAQELEKSGVEVTKERRAALRQKFASGNVQRAGFYTAGDLAKFTGNNGKTTPTPTTAPTVRQTGGYVSPSMRTPVPGFKPGNVQKSTKSNQTGFKELGKDILSSAKTTKKYVDQFIDEATGSAAIQRALDNKGASTKSRIGEGLLGVATGILNISGTGALAGKFRGVSAGKKFVPVTKAKILPSGAKPPLQLNPGQRVIDRVFDMPAVKTPLKKTPTTKTSTKKTSTKKTNAAQQKADQQIESGLATVAPKPVAAKPVAAKPVLEKAPSRADMTMPRFPSAPKIPKIQKPKTPKASSKSKTIFDKTDAQAAPYQDVPKPGSTVNYGQQGVGGNPIFRSRNLGVEGKTITSSGSAGKPAVRPTVPKPVVKKATTPAVSTSPTGQTFRMKFKNLDEYNTWMNTGGKGTLEKQTFTVRDTFQKLNQEFIRANKQRSAGRSAADLARERRRQGAVERLNKMRGTTPREKTPASQDPLKQPKPISDAAKKIAAAKKAAAPKKARSKKAAAKRS